MGETRSKRSRNAGDRSLFPSNVIELGVFRAQKRPESAHCAYYLSENAKWLELLSSFSTITTDDIRSSLSLKCRLLARRPDIILIESGITWADPVDLIDDLSRMLGVPVMLICDPACHKRDPQLLKRAFASGLHDTLLTPLEGEELWETLRVLLKFRSQASQY